MTTDDDLSPLLPSPPPARAARRDATIAMALRRFDGEPEPAGTSAPRAGARGPQGRPRLALVMSAMLLAVIGVPVMLIVIRDQPPSAPVPSSTVRDQQPQRSPTIAVPSEPPPSAIAREEPTAIADDATTSAKISAKPGAAPAGQTDVAARFAPPPAAPPPPPPPLASDQAPAPAMAVTDNAFPAEARDIVVTGSKRASSKAEGRGEWNACTVADPNGSLSHCEKSVGTNAKGEAGIAAGHVANGLASAWRGNLSESLAELDQAVVASPRSASALLNRALVRQRLGDLEAALADLNRAERLDRLDPRIPYHRSIVWAQLGNKRGARADQERAIDLDPAYEQLFR